jgi:hypothetical protein
LEGLSDAQWEELMAITDDQAIYSDIGGDSDADDCFEDSLASTSRHGSRSCQQSSSSSEPLHRSSSSNIPPPAPPQVSVTPPTAPPHPSPPPLLSPPIAIDQPHEGSPENLNKWSKRKFRNPPVYKNSTFNSYIGINKEVDLNSPMNILKLFLTPFFYNLMIIESNRYATQCHQTLNLTEQDFNTFLGILIIMGFHSLPSMRLYWSRDKNFHVSRISSVMSMRRFLKILRYLHANDNEKMIPRGNVGFDRLFKIRPLLTYFSNIFGSVFSPHRQLSIDESMIAFKGRSTLKQYMPLKPIKRGFKVWVICCAVTGYMVNFDIYEGKPQGGQREFSLGESIVLKLASAFEHLGYCLFFDRFFTSLPLLDKLLRKKIFGVGTIMPSRKFFPSNKLPLDRDMAVGESAAAMTESNISVSKWRDRGKKSVCVASNMHNPAKKGFVKRTNTHGNKVNISCPNAIVDYNKYMGGVDKFDQHMASYNIAWKSRRWWMKIWFYLIDAAIVNSYVIYKDTWRKAHPGGTKPMAHLVFRSKLADELIGDSKISYPVQEDENGEHRLIKSTKKNLRRCRYCSTASKPKRSVYECISCNVALCVECFVPYHEAGQKKKV